jgi:nucleotide-binding universal stress UspA family protein
MACFAKDVLRAELSMRDHLANAARDALVRSAPPESDTAAPVPQMSLDELLQVKLIDTDDTLEKEAVKGYSIAFVGVDQPFSKTSHRFEDQLQRLVEAFDGPLGIMFNARPSFDRSANPFRLLVPTGGTIEARLATEIALALAKATDGTVTALHVFDPRDNVAMLRGRSRRQGLSVLVDARRLGKRSGVAVTGLTLSHSRPEAAIERAARSGKYDLVVVGTSLRQGGRKFLGPRSLALVGLLRTPILLVVK